MIEARWQRIYSAHQRSQVQSFLKAILEACGGKTSPEGSRKLLPKRVDNHGLDGQELWPEINQHPIFSF